MKKFTPILFFCCLFISPAIFGQVGIGTSETDPSAVLDLQSTNSGFLLPRMNTLQQKNIQDPASGLIVFNIDSNDIYFFNGSDWLSLRETYDTIHSWGCGDSLIDQRDALVYATVQIGTQCWMAENLNAGTMIYGYESQTNNGQLEKYCYNNDLNSCTIYGGLYQWAEMMQYTSDTAVRGICPVNWHIPTDHEWKILEGTVDSYYGVGDPVWNDFEWRGSDAGGNLKETGTSHWNTPNSGATNSSGFTALPGGYLYASNAFENQGYFGVYWTSTQYDATYAYGRLVIYYDDRVARYYDYNKEYGFSVRCLKDY